MSTLKIENAKKFADLTAIVNAPDDAVLLIHDGAGVKKISVENLKADLREAISTINADGAGAHNSIYRGKFLGDSVTEAQWAAIAANTFKDMYIGDYWTIQNINWRIAAFNYYLNTGDTKCTAPHVVLVPDRSLYNTVMSKNNTGGYVGSDLRLTGLNQAKSMIKNIFGSHVMSHRIYLINADSGGLPTGGTWCDSEVDLMNEQMVYGAPIFMPISDSTVLLNYRVDKSQLPLFSHEPSRINCGDIWWLRDSLPNDNYACVFLTGNAFAYLKNSSIGIRPAFCIS